MYAICRSGGHQLRAEPDQILNIEYRADAKPGDKLVLDDVLLVSKRGKVTVGTPTLDAKIHVTVVDHGRQPKVVVYHKKRRTEYHKMRGHKQRFTQVKVNKIEA